MLKTKLTKTTAQTLTDFIKELELSDIKEFCDSAIYYRGLDYYEKQYVKTIVFDSESELSAEVEKDEMFEVELTLKNNAVYAVCNCPFDDVVCKHTVATLLTIFHQQNQLKIKKIVPVERVKSQAEVFDTAWKNKLKNTLDNPEDRIEIFQQIQAGLQRLFSNERLLHRPAKFEKKLLLNFEKLKPLWKNLPQQVGLCIIDVITEINALMSDGNLVEHEDEYEENYFSAVALNEYIIEFVTQLPKEIKIVYINELQDKIKADDYGMFADIHAQFKDFAPDKLYPL